MQVIFPVVSSMGTTIGYLDGIYHAPGEIVVEIRHQSFWSISFVVLTIFTTSLVLYPIIIRLNRTLLTYSNTLALTNVGMLKVLGSAIAKRDSDTNIHNYRVTLYSVRLGEKLGISAVAMQGLKFTFDASIKIIRKLRGNHLDPEIVDLFLEHAERLYEEICMEDETLLKKKLEECIKAYFQ